MYSLYSLLHVATSARLLTVLPYFEQAEFARAPPEHLPYSLGSTQAMAAGLPRRIQKETQRLLSEPGMLLPPRKPPVFPVHLAYLLSCDLRLPAFAPLHRSRAQWPVSALRRTRTTCGILT